MLKLNILREEMTRRFVSRWTIKKVKIINTYRVVNYSLHLNINYYRIHSSNFCWCKTVFSGERRMLCDFIKWVIIFYHYFLLTMKKIGILLILRNEFGLAHNYWQWFGICSSKTQLWKYKIFFFVKISWSICKFKFSKSVLITLPHHHVKEKSVYFDLKNLCRTVFEL